MPRAMISPNGKRQPRALVVALRRIAKDPKATVKERLRACELQAIIAGYIEGHKDGESDVPRNASSKAESGIRSFPTSKRLKELMGQLRQDEAGKGLPGAEESSPESITP